MRVGTVAVVGGGPAGMAAAWRLSRSGRGVRLYEARESVGGLLRTEQVGGRGADVAVQLLSEGYTRTLELLRSMGLGERLVGAPGRDAFWRGGRAHPLRYGSVSSMVASGALPAGLKLRLGLRYVPYLERHGSALDMNAPVQAAEAGLDEESIAEWGREQMSADFVEWLAYPLLSAYYGVTPEETSAGFFHALARSGMGVEVVGARGGFGALAGKMGEALSRRGVEVRTKAPVRALEPTASGLRIVTDAASEEHDAVVLAVPPKAAADLVPSVELLKHVKSRSTATLVLATRTAASTGWFGLSIPRTEAAGATLAAVCIQEEKGTGVVGAAGGTLVLVPAPPAGERWAEAAPGAVLEEALPALRRVLPEVAADVEEGHLVRLGGAVRVPEPGHFQRLSAFRTDALPPWLALAGDYLVAPTVEGAVRSGLAAADRISVTSGEG